MDEEVCFDTIGPACVPEFTVDTLENPTYLPHNALTSFLNPDRVKTTIRNEELFDEEQCERLVEYSIKNPCVFLTLAATNLIKKMPLLCLGDFADHNLPVRMDIQKKSVYSIYPVAVHQNSSPWKCFVYGRDKMSWKLGDLDQFVLKQWMFLAYCFKSFTCEDGIHHKQPLPYVRLSGTTAGGGHFGKVFKFGLLSEHITVSVENYLTLVRQIPNRSHLILSWTKS